MDLVVGVRLLPHHRGSLGVGLVEEVWWHLAGWLGGWVCLCVTQAGCRGLELVALFCPWPGRVCTRQL